MLIAILIAVLFALAALGFVRLTTLQSRLENVELAELQLDSRLQLMEHAQKNAAKMPAFTTSYKGKPK